MEYIKKKDLIIGEVYTHEYGNICRCDQITSIYIIGKHLGSYRSEFKQPPKNPGNFGVNQMRLATSEEKHWLNSCITADKFITFEEAMKTFIPEYVECLKPQQWRQTIKENGDNLIFKSDFKSTCDRQIIESLKDEGRSSFKPSTKEAYDAQFVVKEPMIENKSELEIWLENTKSLNLSLNDLESYIEDSFTCDFDNIFKKLEGYLSIDKAKILFDKWNNQVIEPLPQFKVIETIETITKVENNEGNQFFIGDIVKSVSGIVQKIESFQYNRDNTQILAFTDYRSLTGIGINKLEHYIEPKIEKSIIIAESVKDMLILKSKGVDSIVISNETLLEKAKRLYPIGTKFKVAHIPNTICTVESHDYHEDCESVVGHLNLLVIEKHHKCETASVWTNDNGWAEIIEYLHGFKIGDKIKSKYGNDIWSIIKIEGNQLIFETNSLPKTNSILAKNAIKVN